MSDIQLTGDSFEDFAVLLNEPLPLDEDDSFDVERYQYEAVGAQMESFFSEPRW